MIEARVQTGDIDVGAELARLERLTPETGAVASFTGLVRGGGITAMTLEHYPAMTRGALDAIAREAAARWPLDGVLVIHRVGRLLPGERIVLAATASRHRAAAFEACAFLMDWLKTKAPFWKREETPQGAHWVEAKAEDDVAAARWEA
jgi:molybdopterin synthase catalytic subunit